MSDSLPGPLVDDEHVSAAAPLDCNDSLARLLTTAAVAVHVDRRLTQKCIQRAAMLLELELSLGVGTAQPSRPQSGLVSWQVMRVKSYVEDKLEHRIRAADLAALVRLSTSHFHHAFRKAFGESPIAYVMQRRIRRAQELMLNSRVSLSQVALECGMCDQAHFSRAFRRIVGTSPSVWRQQLASRHPR
jgi:AraC family transcriptional regulator